MKILPLGPNASQLGLHEWFIYLAKFSFMFPSIIFFLPVQKRYRPSAVFCFPTGTFLPMYSTILFFFGMSSRAKTPLPEIPRPVRNLYSEVCALNFSDIRCWNLFRIEIRYFDDPSFLVVSSPF